MSMQEVRLEPMREKENKELFTGRNKGSELSGFLDEPEEGIEKDAQVSIVRDHIPRDEISLHRDSERGCWFAVVTGGWKR